MSQLVSVRLTDEVLTSIDLHNKKTGGNRSSFVRDACLSLLSTSDKEPVSLVKITSENIEKLKQISSKFSTDHDKFLNTILANIFNEMEQNPFSENYDTTQTIFKMREF